MWLIGAAGGEQQPVPKLLAVLSHNGDGGL